MLIMQVMAQRPIKEHSGFRNAEKMTESHRKCVSVKFSMFPFWFHPLCGVGDLSCNLMFLFLTTRLPQFYFLNFNWFHTNESQANVFFFRDVFTTLKKFNCSAMKPDARFYVWKIQKPVRNLNLNNILIGICVQFWSQTIKKNKYPIVLREFLQKKKYSWQRIWVTWDPE